MEASVQEVVVVVFAQVFVAEALTLMVALPTLMVALGQARTVPASGFGFS